MISSAQKGLVLLSGGLDSATVLALAIKEMTHVEVITFLYGQRHKIEIERARILAKHFFAAQHHFVSIQPDLFKNSALTDKLEVPKDSPINRIPVTYVPCRNTLFLSYALTIAEINEIENIYIGVNEMDYSGYPDCREEYIRSFEVMANLATKLSVEGRIKYKIRTPLIHLKKSEIILTGQSLNVPYELTHSCYDPEQDGKPCLHCDSCRIRINGFRETDKEDPLLAVYGITPLGIRI